MIGVVVVHYEDPVGLDRVLGALERVEDVRVVVADDGSHVAPDPGVRACPVDVVRQKDQGFRAAAARNLGARALLAGGTPQALLFLDGDTIPGPGYVERMAARLERVAAGAPNRRALVVGRRRYADLTGLSPAEVAGFVAAPDPARILADTTWLEEGYARTDDLRRADDTSYRYVISAVLAITPDLFEATGGFDESFVGYGGEDWEFAQRAWLAGADLAHEASALAWHDGPDAAGRDEASATSSTADAVLTRANAETVRVARTVTVPGARDPGLFWEHPDVVVEFDDTGLRPVDVLLTCADLVRGTDARIWLRDGAVLRDGLWPSSDPRVTCGPAPAISLARARFRARLDRPVRLLRPLSDLCADAPRHHPGLILQRTRDQARGEPIPPPRPDPAVRGPRPDGRLEAEWGWHRPDTLPASTGPSHDKERP